jgi:hypothetical protein
VRRFLWALALLAGCGAQHTPDASGPVIDAARYDAFFLWPGMVPPRGASVRTLYLLDGEVRHDGRPHLTRLRMATPHLPGRRVWLVLRVERLDWDEATYGAMLADLAQWRAAGNDVAGVQIDFDAATRGLDRYARFLSGLRARLPAGTALSITGLMDWSAHGDPQELTRLAGIVDEVVVQTYQGRSTIPGYESYFKQMAHFPIPFRVALAQGGRWREPAGLAANPRFGGYVIFMLTRH